MDFMYIKVFSFFFHIIATVYVTRRKCDSNLNKRGDKMSSVEASDLDQGLCESHVSRNVKE